jgi:hypothetical protein
MIYWVVALAVGGFWLAGGLAGDWLNGWFIAFVVMVSLTPFSVIPRRLADAFGGVPKEFHGAPIGCTWPRGG